MTTTAASTRDVRFPLVVVDWSADRNRYDSRWLRLVGPGELSDLHLTSTCQTWDGNGRPVTVQGRSVTMTSTATDPAVANILREWRSRAPLGVAPSTMSGATAIPFLVEDVAVARTKMTDHGATKQAPPWLRVVPAVLMLLSAAAIIPLMRTDALSVAAAFLGYVLAAALMRRWSYPASHWGPEDRRDPHDGVSRVAVASKVVFWAVAAVAATLALLDWAEVVPGLVSWA